jgi:hypothetical protein
MFMSGKFEEQFSQNIVGSFQDPSEGVGVSVSRYDEGSNVSESEPA